MDPELLRNQGLTVSDPIIAKLPNYKFIVGQRASLVTESGTEVWGTLIELSQQDIIKLYSEPSVAEYEPIDVFCEDESQRAIAATTYILPLAYKHKKPENSNYVRALFDICVKTGLPDGYCNQIKRLIAEIDANNKE